MFWYNNVFPRLGFTTNKLFVSTRKEQNGQQLCFIDFDNTWHLKTSKHQHFGTKRHPILASSNESVSLLPPLPPSLPPFPPEAWQQDLDQSALLTFPRLRYEVPYIWPRLRWYEVPDIWPRLRYEVPDIWPRLRYEVPDIWPRLRYEVPDILVLLHSSELDSSNTKSWSHLGPAPSWSLMIAMKMMKR